jgi:hypothetical protein
MSFLVRFRVAAGPVPSWDELLEWCDEQEDFIVEEAAADELQRSIRYVNDATEVALQLDRRDDVEPGVAPFALSIPLHRPLTFAMEAGTLIEQLAERFWLLVEHAPGVARGFDYEAFLDAWSAARGDPASGRHTFDAARLEAAWTWNFSGIELDDEEDDDEPFVPHIRFAVLAGTVQTYVTWTDLDAIVLPRVDFVLVLRLQSALQAGRTPDTALVRWDELAALLPAEPDGDDPVDYWDLTEAAPRARFERASRTWPAVALADLEKVPMAHLLEEDDEA